MTIYTSPVLRSHTREVIPAKKNSKIKKSSPATGDAITKMTHI